MSFQPHADRRSLLKQAKDKMVPLLGGAYFLYQRGVDCSMYGKENKKEIEF
jgi:hypothetical protein